MTPNQMILLRAVCAATSPLTTAELSLLATEHGPAFGENAARNAMSRMEARGLVAGSGKGRAKTWTPTPSAHELVGEIVPDDQDGSLESHLRTYIVLEQLSLAAVVADLLPEGFVLSEHGAVDIMAILDGRDVYERIVEVTARNTEHAYRQAAKQVYGDGDAAPTLVAIAEKQWKPTEVRVNTRQTVSIG